MTHRVPRLALRTAPRTNHRRLRVEGLEDRTVPSFTVAPSFPAGPSNGVGAKPVSVTVGDFNGDGKADVATANTDGRYVSVLLGNGDGTFGPPVSFDIGRTPSFIRAADVNGDGFTDLVTANKADNSVSVLIGNGDGTFIQFGPFSTGANTAPVALDLADVNGDGTPDLAVADSGAATVTLMLNDGSGFFTAAGTVNVTSAPTAVALVDLNGDQKPDLATVSGGFGHLNVNLNAGGGTFGAPTNFTTGFCANAVTTGDFNHDGKADLAVGCIFPSADGVSVLIGKGDGTFVTHPDGFGNQIPFVGYNAGNQTPGGITTADLNGDGNVDLVTANFSSTIEFANNSVSVLPGNPDGTFGPARVFHGGQGPVAVAVADFTGDGKADVLTADEGGPAGTVSLLAGRGDGTLKAAEAVPVTVRNSASTDGIATGDFTGDGIADMAVVAWNVNYNGIIVFPSLGDGEFGPGIPSAPVSGATAVAAADLNGDGKLDLAVTGSAGVTVLLGNGDGTFTAGTATPAGTGPQWVAVADFNNDHKPDLVVADTSSTNGASLLLGNGDGTFQPAVGVGAGGAANYVATADLNADGNADLALVGSSACTVVLGNGDGTFGAPASFNAGGAPGGVALGDLNGDGFPDLAVPSFIPPGGGGSAVLVRLNDGTGHFPTQTQYPTDAFGSEPIGCAILDVDGDGVPDIVAVNDFSDTVSLFSGNGDGTFAPQTIAVVGDRPTWVAAGDFNADGRPDLAVVNSNSGSVTVLTRPAPATHFDVVVDPGPQTAGVSFHVTVTARDAAGHPDPDFRGTVTFGADDTAATLPDPYPFTAADAGTHTFDVTLRAAGDRDLSVTGPVGTVHSTVTVNPAAADQARLAAPAAATAGAPFDLTVTVLDAFGNVATGYTGTVHFSTSDPNPAAVLPADYPFTPADAGVHTFAGGVTLVTAANQMVTAQPAGLASVQAGVAISPAAASHLTLSAPTDAVAGTPVTVTVTAWDPYDNRATGYAGTVQLTCTDSKADGPGDYSFAAGDQGTRTIPVTFKTAGDRSVSVSATGLAGAGPAGIRVSPTAGTQLAFVRGPVNTFALTAQSVGVQLEDVYGNFVSVAVPVPVTLILGAKSPTGARLKGGTGFTDATGRVTFPKLMLTKPGAGYTLDAHGPGGLSGTSAAFTVYAATHFRLTVSSTKVTAGAPFTVTVTALDAHNHPDQTYLGTVHFSGTLVAPEALPADYPFTETDAGVHTFSVTLDRAGLRRLTVADTAKAAVRGRVAVTVVAGAAVRFLVTGFPPSIKANSPHLFTVTAVDAYGNRATGYAGTVTFGATGGAPVLPPAYTFKPLNHGRHSFVVKFTTPGTGLSLTVADQTDPTIKGSEDGITVL